MPRIPPTLPPPPKKRYAPTLKAKQDDPSLNGTKFENDPRIITRLKEGVARGLPPMQAAMLAGFSWRTFSRYRQMARLGVEKYLPIEQAIQDGQAAFSDVCIKQIIKAGLQGVGSKDPDWKALMRMLESLVPDAFKPRVDVDITTEKDLEARRLLDLVRQEVGPEVAERIIQRYLAEGGEGVPGTATGSEGGTGETEEG